MQTLKLRLHYFKVLLAFNLPFSLFMSLTGFMFNEHIMVRIINAFSLSLLTGGFLLSIFLFDQRHSDQYFFYHNKGFSKIGLVAGTFVINLAIVMLLFFVKVYLYA